MQGYSFTYGCDFLENSAKWRLLEALEQIFHTLLERTHTEAERGMVMKVVMTYLLSFDSFTYSCSFMISTFGNSIFLRMSK